MEMRMEQEQNTQQATIKEEIDRLRTRLGNQLAEAQKRLRTAEANVETARLELETARAAAADSEAQFNSYNSTFPAPVAPAKAKAKSVANSPTVKNGNAVKAAPQQSGGGKVVISKSTSKKPGAELTWPERVARVMGNHTMTAGEVLAALDTAGEKFESNNPRSYVSTTLNSSLMNVRGVDGDLRDRNNKLVKVHVFTATERGHYRVATDQDIQTELRKILGASEVVISESRTPADKVFEDQGMDIRPAMAAQHH
jgi:hypothetical protein